MWRRFQNERQGSARDTTTTTKSSTNKALLPKTVALDSGDINTISRPALETKGPGDVLKELPVLPYVRNDFEIGDPI